MKKALSILLPAVIYFSTALFLSGQATPGAPEPPKKEEPKKQDPKKAAPGPAPVAPGPAPVAPAPAPVAPAPTPVAPAPGSGQLPGGQIYEKSLAALTMLFVLAVLLENAFAVIFNWRVFLA